MHIAQNPDGRWAICKNLPGITEGDETGILRLANTEAITEAMVSGIRAMAIYLEFPSYADGRAYSQAVLLRRHGYTGFLCASGPAVTLDQLPQLLACGLNALLLPSEAAAGILMRALAAAVWLVPHAGMGGYDNADTDMRPKPLLSAV